uniref:Protein kinase domain-containing protein n=1 Tax=Globisporangium ultimum (strain ATCC 200006 / CBS 805.95 / DAOM BR144) TaxID=431595 RepID=K3WGN9_GLOUD
MSWGDMDYHGEAPGVTNGLIDTLRHLGKHPNIVSLHDVLYLKDETIMFMDLVQGGELFDYIVDMGSISEKDASRMLRDACRALEYMHSLGICHRDLKPENLLLTTRSPEADIKVAVMTTQDGYMSI